jgi:hemolysin III
MASVPLYHLPAFYEPFAALSHLFGAVLFLWLGWLLLRRARADAWRRSLLAVYVAACVFQFTMSGVFHMLVRDTAANRIAGRLDHAAVFLLIAGIFTPIYGMAYRGRLRQIALSAVWVSVIAGIVSTTVVSNDASEWLRLVLYQAMGWSGIAALIDLWRRHGFVFVWPMLAGSLMMSAGGLAQELGWPAPVPGVIHAHETFHIILLIGAIHQWLFMWQLAGGEPVVTERVQAPVAETATRPPFASPSASCGWNAEMAS